MRVNPNPVPNLLAALNRTRQNEQQALLEMSTGRRVNRPSDDPAAAAVMVENHDQNLLTASYLQSLNSIQGQLQMADSTLSSVELALQRAITLGVEGANGTLSDADRATLVSELKGIQEQVLSLANTSFQGRYLFAGTVTATPPFVKDDAMPSGVRYDGNDVVNTVEVGAGYRVAVNMPGSQILVAPGHDVFQALTGVVRRCSRTRASMPRSYLCGAPSITSRPNACFTAIP